MVTNVETVSQLVVIVVLLSEMLICASELFLFLLT